jgi:hypothetical protein
VPAAKGPSKLPKKFGEWIVESKLDAGGFGTAYLVRNEKNNWPAVVKTLSAEEGDEQYRDNLRIFIREINNLSSLKHPNICKFYNAGIEDSRPWFAMELYRGNHILNDLKQYGPAPEDLWFARAKDILSALSYAHGEGIMHGDLNPKNVIIDGRGAKLIDFGISKRLETSNPVRSVVRWYPGYSSPEHHDDYPMMPSDVFVAASLLTLFGTGHQAFEQIKGGDFRVSIMKDEPNYSGLSSNQKMLLRPMHAKAPEDRISASEALRLLEKLSPTASARPIAKPAAKAKVVAKKPPVKVPAQAKRAVQQLQAAAQKVPDGIELLPNGARVKGWVQQTKRPTLADMPPGFWLLIASILTAGLALIPWAIYKFFMRSSSELDQGIRIRLAVSLFFYLFSFGMLAPLVTWWWARKIGYLHLKVILAIQSVVGLFVLAGTIAESGQSPSGFLWSVRIIAIGTCFWSFSVIKEKLTGKPRLEKKTRQEKKEERASVVTGGHQSWEEVKETLKGALAKHKGTRFIIEILSAEYTDIYFQGYSEPDGAWTIEAAADLAVRPHLSEDQKVKMSMIGWERPSEGLPNFIMFLQADESDDDDLAEIFTKSLRDGYGLSITKFRVMAKER